MRDFKIEVGEKVNINGLNIERVNNIFYYVNDKQVKVKKKDVLFILNNKEEVMMCGKIDLNKLNTQLEYAGRDSAEKISDNIFIVNDEIFVYDPNLIIPTQDNEYEYIESELSEEAKEELERQMNIWLMANGRAVTWDGREARYKSLHIRAFNDDLTNRELFKHRVNDGQDCYNVHHIYEGAKYIDTINNILSKQFGKVSDLFHKNEGFRPFKSASVENLWKNNAGEIISDEFSEVFKYTDINDMDKAIKLMKEIADRLFTKYSIEIERVMKAEQEYKQKSEQESYKRTYHYGFKAKTESDTAQKVKKDVKGMTFKKAMMKHHPDRNLDNLGQATEYSQIINEYREIWWDNNGDWRA